MDAKNNSGLGASSKPLYYIFKFCVKSKRCVSKFATLQDIRDFWQ